MAAFHANERGDFARAADPLDVVDRSRQFEGLGIARDHGLDQRDLFERRSQGLAVVAGAGRHVDRPELHFDAARPQARNVGVHVLLRLCDVELLERRRTLFAEFPRQIVMAIDQRGRGVNRLRPIADHDLAAIGLGAGRRLCNDEDAH